MAQNWLESLVWTDYRVAVLFTVLTPLVLLLWAFVAKADALQKLLVIYWRVSSLLAITVYLMIGSLPVSFVAALGARALIPVSLWFWVDLNDEIDDLPQQRLKFVFKAWRWAMTIYCAIGTVAQLITLPCALKPTEVLVKEASCRVWLEPTWLYREYFHGNTNPSFLGAIGVLGLGIYVLYLAYFVMFRLGKQGRSATGA
jgi:hypothetical protein